MCLAGVFGLFGPLEHFTNIGDGQIGKDDTLQQSVGQIEPKSDDARDDHRHDQVNEFHQDKRTEHVAKKSERQRHRLDEVIENLERQQHRFGIGQGGPESFQADKLNRRHDDIEDGKNGQGDRKRRILGRRRDFEHGREIGQGNKNSDGADKGDDLLCLFITHVRGLAQIEQDTDQAFRNQLTVSLGNLLQIPAKEPTKQKNGDHDDPRRHDGIAEDDLETAEVE